MYVIHDSLVGVETVTFAYIRARAVIRTCFPASFIEYLWVSFPLPPLLHMSLLDLVSCSISLKLWKGWCSWHAPVAQQTPSAWLPFSLAPCHAHAATAPAMSKDRGRHKAAPSIAEGSGAHQDRQLLLAPRMLAGKQEDFKVVATPEQVWKRHSQQMTG